jgi:MFS transporter, BCD family, chlorophyll transporter
VVGEVGAVLAFLLVGAGLHTTQTAGLALATDLAPEESRPRVVALLYVMLLGGMLISSLLIGQAACRFSPTRLVGVVQGAAVVTMVLNLIALWKQEPRRPSETLPDAPRPDFRAAWADFLAVGSTRRLLVAVGLGAAGFAMQDVLLEPYGAEVLGMAVGETTRLTAVWAVGTLAGACGVGRACWPAVWIRSGWPASGLLAGIFAFAMVVVSAPTGLALLLGLGIFFIGFGGGMFGVGTLTAAMALGTRQGRAARGLRWAHGEPFRRRPPGSPS